MALWHTFYRLLLIFIPDLHTQCPIYIKKAIFTMYFDNSYDNLISQE